MQAACSSGTTTLSPARDGSAGAASHSSQRGSLCRPVTQRRIRDACPPAARASLTTSRPPNTSTITLVAVLSDSAVISWATTCSGSRSGNGQLASTPSPAATCSGVASTVVPAERFLGDGERGLLQQEGLDRRRPAVAELAADVEVDAATPQHQRPGAEAGQLAFPDLGDGSGLDHGRRLPTRRPRPARLAFTGSSDAPWRPWPMARIRSHVGAQRLHGLRRDLDRDPLADGPELPLLAVAEELGHRHARLA